MNESKHIQTINASKHHHDQKTFATKRIMNLNATLDSRCIVINMSAGHLSPNQIYVSWQILVSKWV
jgi:hypothetical protein